MIGLQGCVITQTLIILYTLRIYPQLQCGEWQVVCPMPLNVLVWYQICALSMKKSLHEWGYFLVTVLHSNVLAQWMNLHSLDKDITCSLTEFSLIEPGLYFVTLWTRNLLIIQRFFFWECGSLGQSRPNDEKHLVNNDHFMFWSWECNNWGHFPRALVYN